MDDKIMADICTEVALMHLDVITSYSIHYTKLYDLSTHILNPGLILGCTGSVGICVYINIMPVTSQLPISTQPTQDKDFGYNKQSTTYQQSTPTQGAMSMSCETCFWRKESYAIFARFDDRRQCYIFVTIAKCNGVIFLLFSYNFV